MVMSVDTPIIKELAPQFFSRFMATDNVIILPMSVQTEMARVCVKQVFQFRNISFQKRKEDNVPKLFRLEMASALSNMLTVLCSFLSVTVIIACLVLKVPQIFRVFEKKSSKGLSMNSVLLELCG